MLSLFTNKKSEAQRVIEEVRSAVVLIDDFIVQNPNSADIERLQLAVENLEMHLKHMKRHFRVSSWRTVATYSTDGYHIELKEDDETGDRDVVMKDLTRSRSWSDYDIKQITSSKCYRECLQWKNRTLKLENE